MALLCFLTVCLAFLLIRFFSKNNTFCFSLCPFFSVQEINYEKSRVQRGCLYNRHILHMLKCKMWKLREVGLNLSIFAQSHRNIFEIKEKTETQLFLQLPRSLIYCLIKSYLISTVSLDIRFKLSYSLLWNWWRFFHTLCRLLNWS